MLETNTLEQLVYFDSDRVARAYAHVEGMWPILTKDQNLDDGTLIGLPYPYVVPSVEARNGFVFEEMYYWDSYFIAQGLLRSGRKELAEGMLENLIFMAKRFHIIPNASRFYFTGRSQPPLLTTYIFDIYEQCEKNIVWLSERMAVAEKEYNYVWTNNQHPNNRKVYKDLSRNYDINVLDDLAECESGWDHTTRFYGRALSFIPIDLNCMLHKYELDFARAYDLFGEPDTADVWRSKAAYRQKTINEELWSAEDGFYYDLDYQEGQMSHVKSLAAYYAMWSGVATAEQAEQLVGKLGDFLHEGGLSTTTPSHEHERSIAHQWSYPNGWAPLQWMTVKGLVRYGYLDKAELAARRWLNTNIRYFEDHGVFREAYNVIDTLAGPEEGVYPPQVGFGWTNGVFVDMVHQFLNAEELQKI